MTLQRLRAELELDADGFRSELNSAKSNVEDFGDRIESAGRRARRVGGILSATITAPLAALGIQATRAAADAEELGDRAEAVFGDLTTEVEEWAETTADEMGRSRRQLLDHAATLQDMIDPTGEATEETYELSQGMAELAQDVASFQNMNADQVMEKFMSAMAGQSRAVRDLGVDMSAAAVEAELLEMGIEGGTEAATDAQEAQARYNILLRETQAAHGDAERTQDTLTGATRQLRGETANLAEQFGQHLLPYANTLVGSVAGLASWFGDLSEGQQKAIVAGAGLAAVIPLIISGFGMLALSAQAVTGGLAAMGAMKAGVAAIITGGLVPASVAGSGGLLGLAGAAVTAQIALGPVTIPIWLIIAALGALVAGVAAAAYAFRTNLFGIRDTTMAVVDPVTDGIDWLIEKLFGISDATGQVSDAFSGFIDWIIQQVNRIPGIDIGGEGVGFNIEAPDPEDTDIASEYSGMEDDFGELGAASGQSFGESFAESVVDGLETDDAEAHLEGKIESAEERLSELRQGGLRKEDVDEAADLQREIRDLEGQLAGVQEAEDITEIDPDILADAAQAEIDAEEDRQDTLAAVADRIDGADLEQADHGEATPSMVANTLGGGGGERDQPAEDDSLTKDDLTAAFMTALEEFWEGRSMRMEQEMNERRFRGILRDEIDAYLGN